MPRIKSCKNCDHFNAEAVENPSEGLCQKPMLRADPVVRNTDPICHNFKEIIGTCGTCVQWLGSAEICQVGAKKKPPVWKENDPCDQYDDYNQLKYIEKPMSDTTDTTLPENTEAVADEVIDKVQGRDATDEEISDDEVTQEELDALDDNMAARSTDRTGGDCSTCQPKAPGEPDEALA